MTLFPSTTLFRSFIFMVQKGLQSCLLRELRERRDEEGEGEEICEEEEEAIFEDWRGRGDLGGRGRGAKVWLSYE